MTSHTSVPILCRPRAPLAPDADDQPLEKTRGSGLPLNDRPENAALECRETARSLDPGTQREALLRGARRYGVTAQLENWLFLAWIAIAPVSLGISSDWENMACSTIVLFQLCHDGHVVGRIDLTCKDDDDGSKARQLLDHYVSKCGG